MLGSRNHLSQIGHHVLYTVSTQLKTDDVKIISRVFNSKHKAQWNYGQWTLCYVRITFTPTLNSSHNGLTTELVYSPRINTDTWLKPINCPHNTVQDTVSCLAEILLTICSFDQKKLFVPQKWMHVIMTKKLQISGKQRYVITILSLAFACLISSTCGR